MPTPAERKALLFLAGVIVLGASVRVVRAARDDGSSDIAARQALSRQLAAVDSARVGESRGKTAANKRGARRSRGRMFTAADSAAYPDSVSTIRTRRGTRRGASQLERRDTSAALAGPVDLDVAGEADIERLPRIGPVLAHRIVEDRGLNGAFGSLDGFQRVRGVGPALAATLRDQVTFSGTARPSNAIVEPRLRRTAPPQKSHRRERRR